jgi:hypothetical protein
MGRYEVAATRPFSPSFFGYGGHYVPARVAIRETARARDRFVIWMGLFSLVVAHGKARCER